MILASERIIGFPYSMMYGLDWTYLLVIAGAILSLIASARVKSTFHQFERVGNRAGLTGAEAAKRILKSAGIYDVSVVRVQGSLTDHFNSKTRRLALSESVYDSVSVAAIGVAAHECGHAMQYDEDYFPIKVRTAIVPVANFGSKLGIPIILLGLFFSMFDFLIPIGIVLFSFGMIFQLVTLPVEFDASRRALATINDMNLLDQDELRGARKVLKSAAMTYVAAAATSILQVLRLILLFGGGRRRD